MCCIGNSNIIDWGTWAAIASALAAVCSLVITVIIGLSQRRREQQAQKISIFEKRYDIYKSAIRIYNISKILDSNHSDRFVVDTMVGEYNLLNGQDYMVEYLGYEHTNYDRFPEDLKKLNELNTRTYIELYHLKNKLLSELEISKYFFKNDIGDILILYVKRLFDFALALVSSEEKDTTELLKELIKSKKEIEKKDILKQMESCLDIV